MNILLIFTSLLAFSDICKGVEKSDEEKSNLEADSSYLVEQYGYLEDKENHQRNKHAHRRDFEDEFSYRSSGISENDEYDDWDDDKFNVVGLRRDDREDIVRPCSLDDWRCIRKFFAKNSKCKPSFGPISDPLYLRRTTFYIPNVNVSLISTRFRVSGQSQIRVSELYHNKDTGNLVIGLEFQRINLTTPRAYFRYHRTAKESIVLDDFGTVAVGGTITAIIPKIPNLRLDLAEIHVFINDRLPPFAIGPRAVNADPDVVAAFTQLIGNLPTTLQEAGLFIAQIIGAIYIQENICDFGLKFIIV